MQEKEKKSNKKSREREREREGTFFILFFIRKNYAQNKRDSDKFIVRGCE